MNMEYTVESVMGGKFRRAAILAAYIIISIAGGDFGNGNQYRRQ